MLAYYKGKKINYVINRGEKFRVAVDKTKEKPVIVLKRVKSYNKKEDSNS